MQLTVFLPCLLNVTEINSLNCLCLCLSLTVLESCRRPAALSCCRETARFPPKPTTHCLHLLPSSEWRNYSTASQQHLLKIRWIKNYFLRAIFAYLFRFVRLDCRPPPTPRSLPGRSCHRRRAYCKSSKANLQRFFC